MLDGTANIDLIRCVLGDDIEHVHIAVERDADVTLVTGRTFSNASIVGREDDIAEHDAKSRAFLPQLRKGLSRFPGAFLAAPRKVLDRIGYEGPQKHFGALRGLNEFEDCEIAFVLGRQLPGPAEVEAMARAYAFASGSEFRSILDNDQWYLHRYEAARCAAGPGKGISVKCHPDPWAQRILEQICDAEVAQAVDRVRAIHNRRQIFLLTPRIIDITVDHIIDWEEWADGYSCRAEKLMDDVSFVPLSPTERSRHFLQHWSSRTVASNDTKSEEWLKQQDELIEFHYRRRKIGRSRWHKAVAECKLPLSEEVSAQIGPLKDYCVEGDINEILVSLIKNPSWSMIYIENAHGVYATVERAPIDRESLPPSEALSDPKDKRSAED